MGMQEAKFIGSAEIFLWKSLASRKNYSVFLAC